MKKIKIMILVLVLCVSFTSLGFAQESGKENRSNVANENVRVLFEQEEITDYTELLKRAKKGQSDLNVRDLPQQAKIKIPKVALDRLSGINPETKGKLTNPETGEEIDVDAISTTQLLRVTEDENGNTITSFTTTSFTSTDSRGRSDWDKTGGVEARSTIYWDDHSTIYSEWYKLKGATGMWIKHDSSYNYRNLKARLGEAGFRKDNKLYFSDSVEEWPDGTTFEIEAPSDWPAVSGGDSIGVTQYADLQTRSSQWYFTFINNITYSDSLDFWPND